MKRSLTLLFILSMIGGCTASADPSADPSDALPGPTSSADAGYAGCQPIDLRLPSGEPLDLTGTWVGGSTVHHLRQVDDCVWWVGVSDLPGEAPGASWMNSFQGHVHSDFTLSGIWADVYTDRIGNLHEGRTSYRIVTTEVDGEDSITLEQNDEATTEHGIYLRDYYADRLAPSL